MWNVADQASKSLKNKFTHKYKIGLPFPRIEEQRLSRENYYI